MTSASAKARNLLEIDRFIKKPPLGFIRCIEIHIMIRISYHTAPIKSTNIFQFLVKIFHNYVSLPAGANTIRRTFSVWIKEEK